MDCANGAGSSAVAALQQLLLRCCNKELHARNTGKETEADSSSSSSCCCSNLINDCCGTELIQKGNRLPQRFGMPHCAAAAVAAAAVVAAAAAVAAICCCHLPCCCLCRAAVSPEMLLVLLALLVFLFMVLGYRGDPSEGAACCSLDGDADRLVYFAWRRRGAPRSPQGAPRGPPEEGGETLLFLFDGDRIACLFVLLIANLLKAAEAKRARKQWQGGTHCIGFSPC